MDAREKWIEAAEKLAEQMVLLDSCSAMSVGNDANPKSPIQPHAKRADTYFKTLSNAGSN